MILASKNTNQDFKPFGVSRQIGDDIIGFTTCVISHTFDGAGRLTHSDYSTGEAFAYQYDAAGNRTVVTSTTPLSGTVVTTNSYDAANRLTARQRSDGHAYTYDWSPHGQLLTEWTQGYPVRAFSYDGAGRMIQARVFTQTTEFVYNGLGARLAVSVDGYGTTRYTLDYAAGNRILAESTPTETVSYLYGHNCLGEQRDDEWLYYLHDAEGYVRQGTDITGDVVSAWLFDPDGTVLEGPNGPVSHLICGGVYDWSTGLIYRGGRYFDPNLGIWLALTPLLVVQGWRKRKDKRQWVLLVCVGLFAVGSLAGCGPGTSFPTPTPTRTSIPPTLTGTVCTGTPTPTPTPKPPTETPPPPTETPPPPCPCGAAPVGWRWRLLPLDNPGAEFYITNYNTTLEINHPLQPGEDGIAAQGLDLQRQVSREFAAGVIQQGSGLLALGGEGDYNGYVNWNSDSGDTPETATFRRTYCPETANGCARELETGATVGSIPDRELTGVEVFGANPDDPAGGTRVCIESLNRQITVNDVGGQVEKYQIDVYVGLEDGASELSFPGNHHSRAWRLEKIE